MENFAGAAGQNASSNEIKNCPLAEYHPNLWGDHFLNCTPPPQVIRMDPIRGGTRNYSFGSPKDNMEKNYFSSFKNRQHKLIHEKSYNIYIDNLFKRINLKQQSRSLF